jgi:hypothetical protein
MKDRNPCHRNMPYANLTLMSNRVAEERFPTFLSFGLLCAGALSFVVALVFAIRFYIRVPFADNWNIIDEIVMNHGRGSLQLLWQQHNEHRMALAKLLMWADLFWMQGRDISLFVEIYLTQLLEAVLLALAVRRIGKWPWIQTRAVLGVALYCAFCPLQHEAFLWSIEIQTVLTYALIVFAYVAFTIYSEEGKRNWLWAALAAAFITPFTLASGLIVWPGLLLIAWNLRAKLRVLGTVAVCATFSIGTYLFHYVSPSHHADNSESLRRPFAVLNYILIYLGSTWDAFGRPLGYVLTSLALCLVVGLTVKTAVRRDEPAFRVLIITLAGTLAATAFGTALGRLNFGLEQAASSRYQNCALLFWSCIFVLSLDLLRQYRERLVWPTSAVVLAIFFLSLPHIKGPWQEAEQWAADIRATEPALIADVKDDQAITNLISAPYLTFRDIDFMRAHSISIYSTLEYRRMGVALNSIYEITQPDACVGYFDYVQPVPDPDWPGYRAFGWAWDKKLGVRIENIIITNENKRIIGLGVDGIPRPDVKSIVPGVTSSFTGWKGYINNSYTWRSAFAYGLLADGHTVCQIPGVPVQHPAEPIH